MSELDDRKQVILRAVVIEYVLTAEPIGSQALTEKYPLGVKSATVRNELAEMSDLGLLEQPHTSAGRIPSDLGYRYYVDRLIERHDPGSSAVETVREATHDGEALQAMLGDATRALSRMTQLLSVATTLRGTDVTLRHAVLTATGPTQGLLVAIFSNGHIENRMLTVPPGLSLEDVGRVNEALSKHVAGTTVSGLGRLKSPPGQWSPAIDELMGSLWAALKDIGTDYARGQLVMEGEEFLLAQPEFRRDFQTLREVLDLLTDQDAIYEAVNEPADKAATVRIGRENRIEPIRSLSMVRRTFFAGETPAGTIALIGPTRMAYDSGITLVSLTAQAISDALARFAR